MIQIEYFSNHYAIKLFDTQALYYKLINTHVILGRGGAQCSLTPKLVMLADFKKASESSQNNNNTTMTIEIWDQAKPAPGLRV